MEAKENNSNLPVKVEETIQKAEEIIETGKSMVENINTTTTNLGQAAININELGQTLVQSQRIASDTTLGLERIRSNHQTINKHIDLEYSKQKQAMDVAETVIDTGLKSGNIDLVRMGLDKLVGVANHNPMTDMKNHLDSKMEKSFDDDDFIIEI